MVLLQVKGLREVLLGLGSNKIQAHCDYYKRRVKRKGFYFFLLLFRLKKCFIYCLSLWYLEMIDTTFFQTDTSTSTPS